MTRRRAILEELEQLRRGRLHDGPCQRRSHGRLYAGRQADAAAVLRSWPVSIMRSAAGRLCGLCRRTTRITASWSANIATYKVPLIDMFLYVCDKVRLRASSRSDDEQTDMLDDAKVQMTSAKHQLQGEHYSRMLIYSDAAGQRRRDLRTSPTPSLEIAQKLLSRTRTCLSGGQFHQRVRL